MVPNPSANVNFDVGAFNPGLQPRIEICALDVTAGASETVVNALPVPGCKPAGYSVTFSGSQIALDLPNEQYQVDWKIPNSAVDNNYRVFAYVGTTLLGRADVRTANSGNASNFVIRKDGNRLPIKFRIEEFALCADPQQGGCSSTTVNRSTGGSAFFTDENNETVAGVTVPPQSGPPINFTISECTGGNLPIDIPLFGTCVTIVTDPVIDEDNPLVVPGEVFVCDVEPLVTGLSASQQPLVTLHRKHGSTVEALPHADGACPVSIGASDFSLKRLVQAVAHREWKTARKQVLSLLGPKPLYARRLDVGPGGRTAEFSDFQFALPAYLEIVAATDNQSAFAGTILPSDPTVTVKDLNGDPVGGATVRFVVLSGGGTPTSEVAVLSNATTGLAGAAWTLGSTPGSNTLKASGVGIAGDDPNNGPRTGVDPFIPLRNHPPQFTDASDGPAVVLGTGSVTFSATGTSALYGSSFAPSSTAPGASTLYSIDPSTGTASFIGLIGFDRVGAMATHPASGVLYATGQRQSDDTPVLITINVNTGAGTEVGATGILGSISDLAFRSDGVLFAYDAFPPDHKLYTINIATGAATEVGNLQLNTNSGNGIEFDGAGVLHHSNRDFAYTLDQTLGTATQGAAMSFPGGCTTGRVAAATLDPVGGAFFGSINCNEGYSLGTVDYSTGVVTFIGPTAADLDGLAFGPAPTGCGLCVSVQGSVSRRGQSVTASDFFAGPFRSGSNQPLARAPNAARPAKSAQRPRQ